MNITMVAQKPDEAVVWVAHIFIALSPVPEGVIMRGTANPTVVVGAELWQVSIGVRLPSGDITDHMFLFPSREQAATVAARLVPDVLKQYADHNERCPELH